MQENAFQNKKTFGLKKSTRGAARLKTKSITQLRNSAKLKGKNIEPLFTLYNISDDLNVVSPKTILLDVFFGKMKSREIISICKFSPYSNLLVIQNIKI